MNLVSRIDRMVEGKEKKTTCPSCGKRKLVVTDMGKGWFRSECSGCLFVNDGGDPKTAPGMRVMRDKRDKR